MTSLTETELLAAFREIDRADVELAPDQRYPLPFKQMLAWAVGPRAYLVFRDRPDGKPRGIVFHRNAGGVPDAAAMCEWCHSVRGHGGVKLMSMRADERRRVGLYLCADVGCIARSQEPPGPDDVNDRVDGEERARRALRRVVEFASRRLF